MGTSQALFGRWLWNGGLVNIMNPILSQPYAQADNLIPPVPYGQDPYLSQSQTSGGVGAPVPVPNNDQEAIALVQQAQQQHANLSGSALDDHTASVAQALQSYNAMANTPVSNRIVSILASKGAIGK